MGFLVQNPHSSHRNSNDYTGMSRRSIRRIDKKYPCHMKLDQELLESDNRWPVEFCL